MKNKILSLLKESSGYVSSEEISKRCSISEDAILEHINHLREEGYLIEASLKNGYILIKCPDLFSYDEINDLLRTKYMGRNFVYLDTTSSTNDVVKKLAIAGEYEGLTVMAEQQVSGRGRMGRTWNTHKGECIAMSILLTPNISPQLAPSLTPILAISTVEAIKKETGVDVGIKWPNDIVLNGKKLCGILTEMSAQLDRVNYIVAGIGININQEHFEEDISNIAISLKMFTNKIYDRKKLVAGILNTFEEHYELFKKEGLKPFIAYLKRYSVIVGRVVSITDINGSITGRAVDIDYDGGLLVRLDDGETVKIFSGDVTTQGLYKV